ncbi:MAG TPA: recombinase family protein [Acidobacteriaceae bacterium]|nr:recombinase family protein [Acidobacteriaceae bacterium]
MNKLTAERLERGAMIYIRQSTPGQVLHHQESQRRQYGLQDRARELGFQQITVIDEDLGRSASGLVTRTGFEQLLGAICAGSAGAIFCIEASRLARNGREWHHLIDLCGLAGTVIVDPDGVYDPGLMNDRLLLGLKGTMNEFELNLFRQRSVEAIRQKAQRGELQYLLPVGYLWTADGRIEKDPDQRVQQTIEMVFGKVRELGSARQVLLWFRREGLSLPIRTREQPGGGTMWGPPRYSPLLKMLANPIYSGAYAFGKTQGRTRIVEGQARKTKGHAKPRAEWTVLLRDHHPGYITWGQYDGNQIMLANNLHMKPDGEPKAGRGGRALLSGMLRCRRCGHMLYVAYSGNSGSVQRYQCRGAHMSTGAERCISFSGGRVDEAVGEEILRAIGGNAMEAAMEATEKLRQQVAERRRAVELEIEQARYEVKLAARRYDAVDPDNRLVAGELEARWNAGLKKAQEMEARLRDFDNSEKMPAIPDKEVLLSLAQDLPAIWKSPKTDAGLKQRIVRILAEEFVVDVDEAKNDVVLLIHWAGGRHSELRVKKTSTGQHGRTTGIEAVEVIRQMAGKYTDGDIACTLNRLRLATGTGNGWNADRVYGFRRNHNLANYQPVCQEDKKAVTLEEAAERLQVSTSIIKRMIQGKILQATQVVPFAPWEISVAALASPAVKEALGVSHSRRRPQTAPTEQDAPLFS